MVDMTIDPGKINSLEDIKKLFKHFKSFKDFVSEFKNEFPIEIVPVVKYIVLLYSEDSFLNQTPPLSLAERRRSAAKIAKLPQVEGQYTAMVKDAVFDLGNSFIFKFIFEYLIRERSHLWQDIITLETQMLENQMLRMRPLDEDKGKDELRAFKDKDAMSEMYKKWRRQLSDLYDEFYGKNEKLRAIHKINRANMATIENYATLV